jgi:hypothetical protein
VDISVKDDVTASLLNSVSSFMISPLRRVCGFLKRDPRLSHMKIESQKMEVAIMDVLAAMK